MALQLLGCDMETASNAVYLIRLDIGACGPEIAKSREMAWGRHSIHFPKHSAMPGGCLAEHQRTRISGLPDSLIF